MVTLRGKMDYHKICDRSNSLKSILKDTDCYVFLSALGNWTNHMPWMWFGAWHAGVMMDRRASAKTLNMAAMVKVLDATFDAVLVEIPIYIFE